MRHMMNRAVISPYGLQELVRKAYRRMGIEPASVRVRTDGSVLVDWVPEIGGITEAELLAEIEGGTK